MYAQAAIKPNTLLRNGAYGIVMRGVQKCTCAGASLRGRYSAPLCCIKLDTATDPACGSGNFLTETYISIRRLENKVLDKNCNIYKQGKNWYCEVENIKITINSYSYTIITAHIVK